MKYVLKASLIAAILCPAAFFGCSKSSNNPTTPTPANTVRLSNNATFGNILTDSAGNTLYFFSPDVKGQSVCTGGCLAAWPSFYTPKITLDNGLQDSDFAVIQRVDGSLQTTYKGWPLYYYTNDTKAGQVNGDGLDNVWFVAKPDYSVMLAEGTIKGADSLNYDSTGQVITTAVSVEYITDDRGVTLYSFSHDSAGVNKFTTANFSDNSIWPIYQVSVVGKVPSVLSPANFAVINVFGKSQLTYKGWPLYYYGGDNGVRGTTAGISIPKSGSDVWPIAREFAAPAP
jgi:predicted lipoprotein with Yx(FWY)xxD motif